MDLATIRAAALQLKVEGIPISIRNIHNITGGSFRDITRLLRQVREEMAKPSTPLSEWDFLKERCVLA